MKKTVLFCAIALLSFVANADAPSTSGVVVRGSEVGAWWWVDEDAGLGAAIGGDVVAFCSGTVELGFSNYSAKVIRDGLRLVFLEKGENLGASVWPFTEFDCARILTELPLATGEVKRVFHDNDLIGPGNCDLKNNIDAWGESFHGTLYSPSGEKRQFSGQFRQVYDCDTDSVVFSEVKLLLTR